MLREKYLNHLEVIENISIKNNISDLIVNEIKNLKDDISRFKMRVPLVGGFNAGKSSIINNYLGEKILPEEITPETAIASEIKYGENKILAHGNDGKVTVHPLSDIKLLDSNKFKYIEIFINNERLKKLDEDLVIVDMPGFDSKLENHNSAILQYLDNGVAFILVIDCEDGCMKSSLLTFLYELSSYQLNFSVVVNKSDKKMENDLENIVETVRRTVYPINDHAIIETSSIFKEDSRDKFEKLLKSFDKNVILKKCYEEKIIDLSSRVLSNLNIIIENSSVDEEEINSKIKEIESKILDLDTLLKDEERNIDNKLQSQTKMKIMEDIRSSLSYNGQTLASAMLEGENVFKTTLNELLRPILINTTGANLEPLFLGLITNVTREFDSIEKIALEAQSKVLQASSSISSIEKSFEILKNNQEMFKKLEKYYKVGTTGLAILTTVVAPWLELIIIFLPDILKIFNVFREDKKMEKAREKVENEIIPSIVEKLRPEIEKSLQEIKNEFMEDVKKDISQRKVDLEESLSQALNMKKMKQDEFNKYIEAIKKDIKIVKELLEILYDGEMTYEKC